MDQAPLSPPSPPPSPAATRMIRMDHAHVLAQYHKLRADMPPSRRGAICLDICRALEIHAQLEEETFYPALRELDVALPALEHHLADHARIRLEIERIRQLGEQADELTAALHALMDDVRPHMAEEEARLLPVAEQGLGAQRLQALGAQMTRRRFELTRPHAADTTTERVRTLP